MPGKPYKPGESGNPGGRPNFTAILKRLNEKPEAVRDELVRKAIDIVRAGPKGQTDSIYKHHYDFLCAHLGMKPRDVVEHHFPTRSPEDLAAMSDEELDAYIAAAEARLEAAKSERDGEESAPDGTPVH